MKGDWPVSGAWCKVWQGCWPLKFGEAPLWVGLVCSKRSVEASGWLGQANPPQKVAETQRVSFSGRSAFAVNILNLHSLHPLEKWPVLSCSSDVHVRYLFTLFSVAQTSALLQTVLPANLLTAPQYFTQICQRKTSFTLGAKLSSPSQA